MLQAGGAEPLGPGGGLDRGQRPGVRQRRELDAQPLDGVGDVVGDLPADQPADVLGLPGGERYAQDWATWMKFCTAEGVPLLAVTTGTLVMFTEWLWTQPGWKSGTFTAPTTISRRITGTVVSARTDRGIRLEEGVARLARRQP
ncbi:hypothetical protein B6R96_36215 (plasmid) [Streptomyces sp. Sge12]|uniref:hypothetical protein n=1 Tax=Streptomyces sp. Sge12 TaxID=1972846 RepID=UPI0009C2C99B|nr:hypothetical protein [Streptomyces sp. Sge12]ARE79468.1 hypothetical protein B6R96_36215 [Streptomyces sp. Sge12]